MHVNYLQRWYDIDCNGARQSRRGRLDRRTVLFGVPSRSQYLEREKNEEDQVVIQQAMHSKSASDFLRGQESV